MRGANFNMGRFCHNLCINEISGLYGKEYEKYGWCKICGVHYLKPTPVRCYCCKTIIRQNPHNSKSKYKKELVRIE